MRELQAQYIPISDVEEDGVSQLQAGKAVPIQARIVEVQSVYVAYKQGRDDWIRAVQVNLKQLSDNYRKAGKLLEAKAINRAIERLR